MKKTASMIYRFIFILFSSWGIFRKIGGGILNFGAEMIDFTIFTDFLCLIVMLIVFIISINTRPGRVINGIKSALTLCAVLVLFNNYKLINTDITYDWILAILLPIMMIADKIIFDENGNYKWFDPLLWILGFIIVLAGLSAILTKLFGSNDLTNILNIFNNKDELLNMLSKAFLFSLLLFLLDMLKNAFGKKKFKKAFSVGYRLLFLVLEIFAFLGKFGKELTSLLNNVRYYEILVNFMAFVCICIVVIFSLLKIGRKGTNPFPRLKGAFTVAIIIIPIARVVVGDNVMALSIHDIILNVIAPVMMLFDWILFDGKGYFKTFDPLLWTLIPLFYFCASVAYIIPRFGNMYYKLFSYPQPEMFLCSLAAVLIIGYVIFIIDKIASSNS